jgi:hypothetical protein
MLRLAIFAASAVIAAPALAQAVALAPEEAVTLRLDGEAAPAERGRAEWTPFDIAIARHMSGLPIPEAPVPFASPLPNGPSIPEAPPIRAGVVRLRFMSIAGQHSLLIVENGYDQALVYRARMTRDGETGPTDVCLVTPRRRGFEHWPHPIERIELTDFRFIPWRPGEPQPCR